MKDQIQTYVQLYLGNIQLDVCVTKDLKIEGGYLKNSGNVIVSSGRIDGEDCFWDNLEFFYNIGEKEFEEECGDELRDKGFNIDETFISVKRLLKRAFKLGILIK